MVQPSPLDPLDIITGCGINSNLCDPVSQEVEVISECSPPMRSSPASVFNIATSPPTSTSPTIIIKPDTASSPMQIISNSKTLIIDNGIIKILDTPPISPEGISNSSPPHSPQSEPQVIDLEPF